MDTQRTALKLFVQTPAEVPSDEYILFFHRVIQAGLLPETFVDVTDYSHVPDGPGVMLICHEAHYGMDRGGGRLGLRCATKRGATGDTAARIQRVVAKTLRAAAAMEAHEVLGGKVRFATGSLLFSIEDRLLAPNTAATFEAVAPVLTEVVTRIWGAEPKLARVGGAKECFQVEVSVPVSPPLGELLGRC